MKTTRLMIVGLILCATCYAGELPLVELIDPRSPSKDIVGVITTKDGRKVQAHLRTFGSERIEQARGFGQSVAANPDRELRVREKAFELYPSDPFFQKCFRQYALAP